MTKKILKIFSLPRMINILILLGLLLSIGSILIAQFYLSRYRFFKNRELVAIVDCDKMPKTGESFLNIELFPKTDNTRKKTFLFNADEWVIEGRIIQWRSFMGMFGVRSYYQVERLCGRYLDIEKEKKYPRIVYELYDKPDAFWYFVYRNQRLIPFIEAAYGNSAFIRFEAGKVFYVYVTNSGFMIKDMTEPKKRSWWFVG